VPLRRRLFEAALDGQQHAFTKSFIHADQPLARVLATCSSPGCGGVLLPLK
jgi:hypothetical protein